MELECYSMNFKVLHINSAEGMKQYSDIILSRNLNDPYCQLDYLDIFCGGLKNLICFSFDDSKSKSWILMLGYLNPINVGCKITPYFDFISPYGYSGPIKSPNISQSEEILFWEKVDLWYSENNIISEFIRFNLFYSTLNYSGNVIPTMQNIRGKIVSEDLQWNSFDRKVRKNVKRAIKEELSYSIHFKQISESHIVDFYHIYKATMHRTNAKAVYYYSLERLKYFVQQNEEYCAICTIYYKMKPISSEIILISDDSVYSFLGGTLSEYYDKRPNDYLKYQVINWARIRCKSYYILGGGYGNEDGIFKYKKSFFPSDVVEYKTGRKIVQNATYLNLIAQVNLHRSSLGKVVLDVDDDSFFPLYNKPYL